MVFTRMKREYHLVKVGISGDVNGLEKAWKGRLPAPSCEQCSIA